MKFGCLIYKETKREIKFGLTNAPPNYQSSKNWKSELHDALD
jgi:hypothetical protein